MNILIYESPVRVSHFARSVLRARGHGVALASDSETAILKIDTDLFDAVVIGSEESSREILEFLGREFPQLPVVLAGSPAPEGVTARIVAILPAPLSAVQLAATFKDLAHRREERLSSLSVTLAAEGLSIACRLADLTPETMVLAGESEDFHRWCRRAPGHALATVADTTLGGCVASAEPARRPRRVKVHLDDRAPARALLTQLLKD
jgi:hypothetical protein